jgi:elongation factor Ts
LERLLGGADLAQQNKSVNSGINVNFFSVKIMNAISGSAIKELRERTGAGMLDCKEALVEAEGSIEKAIEILRKKGIKNLGKRADKVASEGVLGCYVHPGDQIAALVEINSETDFVARRDDFKDFARNIAMHIAASSPQYLSIEEVPASVVEKEKEIAMEQLTEGQKKNAEMILEGKLKKFYEDVVLLNQVYIKDPAGKQTITELLQELSVKTGEKIVIRRFLRYEVGEGIEKREENFAESVRAAAGV